MTVIDALQHHLDQPVRADLERIREAAGSTTHNLDNGELNEYNHIYRQN